VEQLGWFGGNFMQYEFDRHLFGKYILIRKDELQMTWEELSELVNVSRATLHGFSNDKKERTPHMSAFLAICNGLDVSPALFFKER